MDFSKAESNPLNSLRILQRSPSVFSDERLSVKKKSTEDIKVDKFDHKLIHFTYTVGEETSQDTLSAMQLLYVFAKKPK